MKTFALLAACGVATLAGCQVSGDRDVDTAQRPAARAQVADAGADYSMAYQAIEDNQWEVSPGAEALSGGRIKRGETVMLSRTPEPNVLWVPARLPDGTIGYVRPIKYRPVAGR